MAGQGYFPASPILLGSFLPIDLSAPSGVLGICLDAAYSPTLPGYTLPLRTCEIPRVQSKRAERIALGINSQFKPRFPLTQPGI